MDRQALGAFFSRALRRLTRSDAPRGAVWRAFAERQECLAKFGHESLAGPRASYAGELDGVFASSPASWGRGHEDIGSTQSMTTG